MGRLILVIGGARSGKSTYCLKQARHYKRVAFIATCEGLDEEMRRRIRMHQKARPRNWKTFEETGDIAPLIRKVGDSFDCIIVDCLTLLTSNLMLSGAGTKEILSSVRGMIAELKRKRGVSFIVSNEVGLGIVPEHKSGRDFRDIAGGVNQEVAAAADEVIFTVAGIPLTIKPFHHHRPKGGVFRLG